MKKIKQHTQINKSTTYDDTLAVGATLESAAESIQDDLNALRSQVKRLAGGANWYDEPAPIGPTKDWRLVRAFDYFADLTTSKVFGELYATVKAMTTNNSNGFPAYPPHLGGRLIVGSNSGSLEYIARLDFTVDLDRGGFNFKIRFRFLIVNFAASLILEIGLLSLTRSDLRAGVQITSNGTVITAEGYADGDGASVTNTSQVLTSGVFYTAETEVSLLTHTFRILNSSGDIIWEETMMNDLANESTMELGVRLIYASTPDAVLAIDSLEIFSA